MYEDFRLLSYWKQKHRIRKLWETLRKILGGILYGGAGRVNILERLLRLEKSINFFAYRLKQFTPGGRGTRYRYDVDFTIEEEEFLPDLIITNINTIIYAHYALFEITIKNTGEEIAGSSTLNVHVDGEDEYDTNISTPALDIDGEIILYSSFPYYELGTAESYTVIGTADVNNVVEESNEGNNIKSNNFVGKKTHEEENPPDSGKGYLFYHIHNPEGIEINSITGVGSTTATLYYIRQPEGTPSGTVYGAHNEATHINPSGGSMLQLPAGTYHLTASFNGMTILKTVNIPDGGVATETFTFSRIEVTDSISDSRNYNHDFEVDGDGTEHSNFDYFFGDTPMGVFRTRYKGSGTHWHTYGAFIQDLSLEGITLHIDGTCDVTGAGYSGKLEMGAHSYPWSGGIYIQWDLNVNIKAQAFDWWYCQHGNSNDYITIKGQVGYSSRTICKKDNTGYHLDTTWAGDDITSFPVTDGENANIDANPNAGQADWDSEGNIADFHISSVPYDLDGNGVKG